ncbi:amidohydrolase family protein [Acidipila sp. EB88]|uniref:amidohydrolase family protein n=1 Tax=Acidipila sp. EB88 TaxID=2305226 RepID=UPI000F5DF211|nr:amidohydrolase family protein [Acidipila sp. EB88]RRA49180.1 amidohydrolase [Acidipila sp. EB88]
MRHCRFIPLAFFLVLVAATVFGQQVAAPPPLAVEHVTVLPMTADGAVLVDQTVLIRNGRIASIAPSAGTRIDAAVMRVDGTGKFLMPGLADAHVHLENDRLLRLFLQNPAIATGTIHTEDVLLPYVANGVLQVIDLSATSETVGQRDEVESGRVVGPHIAMAAMIDGPDPVWPVGITRVAATPSDGRQAVRDASAEGYEVIKVYSRLDLPTFTAIVDEARRLRMPVVGHIPQRGKHLTAQFFQPGFGMVAHAEEFAQQTAVPAEADIPRYVEMAKSNGTWLTGTLSLDERLLEETAHPETLKTRPELHFLTPPLYAMVTEQNPYVQQASPQRLAYLRAIVEFNRKLVPAFAAAHIPVLAGTDTPVPGMVAGFALHDELEAMARYGLSNRQVLEGATRLPAEWLGVAEDRGVVAVGKRADLLLLDANPMENVANTRRIAAVIVGGRLRKRHELDEQMRELAQRYRQSRPGTVTSLHDGTPGP